LRIPARGENLGNLKRRILGIFVQELLKRRIRFSFSSERLVDKREILSAVPRVGQRLHYRKCFSGFSPGYKDLCEAICDLHVTRVRVARSTHIGFGRLQFAGKSMTPRAIG
jgi:hypothetical protein